MRLMLLLGLTFCLSACGGASSGGPRPQTKPVPIDAPSTVKAPRPDTLDRRGLGDVMGKTVADLKRMFGEPRLDIVEVNGRKLQFSGKPCVLDAYLYPDGKNGQEIVTHIDARRSDGAEVDRAACVNALSRR